VHNGFFGDGPISRAAFVVEKAEHFAERVSAGGVPEKSAGAADANEADLAKLFEMVGESGGGDVEFVLNFAGDHAGGVSGEKEAENLQARLSTESGEAVSGASNEEGIRPGHISIIAEIR
jgi:hypothetical protein